MDPKPGSEDAFSNAVAAGATAALACMGETPPRLGVCAGEHNGMSSATRTRAAVAAGAEQGALRGVWRGWSSSTAWRPA